MGSARGARTPAARGRWAPVAAALVLAAFAIPGCALNRSEVEEQFLHSPVPVLVEMYTTWCPPCKQQAPIVDELAEDAGGAYRVVEVDLEQHESLADRYEIEAVPTLLIFSGGRETKRFVIPKGWRMKGKSDAQAAAREAGQEAGVGGRIDPVPIGTYRYWKRLRRTFVPVSVTVYGLEVEDELDDWKERGERSREWLTREQAISLVDEPELVTLIAGFTPPA